MSHLKIQDSFFLSPVFVPATTVITVIALEIISKNMNFQHKLSIILYTP